MKLTAAERAEKALPDLLLEHLPKGWIVSMRHDVAAQIEQYGREAFKSGCNTHLATCSERFDEGFAAAQAMARGIAESQRGIGIVESSYTYGWDKACDRLVERIAAMRRPE